MSRGSNTSAGEQPTNASPGVDRGSRVHSLDTIFELLVAERRRNALYVLYRSTGSVSLSSLADEVASLEGTETERVAAALHHVHLPKLVEVGVVEYDDAAETVCLTDSSERFRRYLTTAA